MIYPKDDQSSDFCFWRIRITDGELPFQTLNLTFDAVNPSTTLQEYYLQDIAVQGNNLTYLFGQKFLPDPAIYGILRYRDAKAQDLLEEIVKVNPDQSIVKKINQLLVTDKPHVVYLSRIGIANKMQRKGIGYLLKDFFEFLLKNASNTTLIYVKVTNQSEKMLGNQYQRIGEGVDKKWGRYCLYIKFLLLK